MTLSSSVPPPSRPGPPPPILPHSVPLYPSKTLSVLLKRMKPEDGEPSRCAVVPTGSCPEPVEEVCHDVVLADGSGLPRGSVVDFELVGRGIEIEVACGERVSVPVCRGVRGEGSKVCVLEVVESGFGCGLCSFGCGLRCFGSSLCGLRIGVCCGCRCSRCSTSGSGVRASRGSRIAG